MHPLKRNDMLPNGTREDANSYTPISRKPDHSYFTPSKDKKLISVHNLFLIRQRTCIYENGDDGPLRKWVPSYIKGWIRLGEEGVYPLPASRESPNPLSP